MKLNTPLSTKIFSAVSGIAFTSCYIPRLFPKPCAAALKLCPLWSWRTSTGGTATDFYPSREDLWLLRKFQPWLRKTHFGVNPAQKNGFVQSTSNGSNCGYGHRRAGDVTNPAVTEHSPFCRPELAMAFSTAHLPLRPCGLGQVTQVNPPPLQQHTPSLLSCGHLVSKRSWCVSVPACGGSALLLPCSSISRGKAGLSGGDWSLPLETTISNTYSTERREDP